MIACCTCRAGGVRALVKLEVDHGRLSVVGREEEGEVHPRAEPWVARMILQWRLQAYLVYEVNWRDDELDWVCSFQESHLPEVSSPWMWLAYCAGNALLRLPALRCRGSCWQNAGLWDLGFSLHSVAMLEEVEGGVLMLAVLVEVPHCQQVCQDGIRSEDVHSTGEAARTAQLKDVQGRWESPRELLTEALVDSVCCEPQAAEEAPVGIGSDCLG